MHKKAIVKIAILGLFAMSMLAFSPIRSIHLSKPAPYVELCEMENKTFKAGEEIVYKLYYNWNFVWLSAGEVTFKVNEKNGQYHLSAAGRTYSSYEWFFKVRDYYDTYIDKESLLPTMATREIHEGKYNLYEKVTFDQSTHTAVSERGKTKEDTPRRRTFDTGDCMHDVLSVIYYARNIAFDDFDAGHSFPVKIFMDKEVHPLQVKYKGKNDNKKIKGKGRYKTIQFSPEVIAGDVFDDDTEMNVWVSDDGNRIPLLIESPVSVGSVKAVLKSYNGLKYPMEAKVK